VHLLAPECDFLTGGEVRPHIEPDFRLSLRHKRTDDVRS
jgi:hypothetical protein